MATYKCFSTEVLSITTYRQNIGNKLEMQIAHKIWLKFLFRKVI